MDDDWLFAALAASVASFAVGMLTFDAFSFTQVTFIFWILLGLSADSLRISGRRRREMFRKPRHSRVRWLR